MKKFLVYWIPMILLWALLLFLLIWRWKVSSIRFFDVDEFSYLHWSVQVARGQLQYVDFFSYFTPGFMWVLAPIYWIYGVSTQVFTAARTVAFLIFLGILGSVSYLFGITRGWKWAVLPAIILAFLPMPYDKFLEIRPDNLATLFALLGIIMEAAAIRKNTMLTWLATGIFYSASLFVLVKTLPIVLVGSGIAVLSIFYSRTPRSHKLLLWEGWSNLVFFSLGLFGPWVLFFFGAWATGHFSVIWYSITKLPFESSGGAIVWPMEPDLFFFPNGFFYGGDGHSLTTALIVNHVLWLIGIFAGAYRLVTPFDRPHKRDIYIEFLVGGAFFVSVLGYTKFFPLKHTQYLIPIAIFVAYFAADAISTFFSWLIRVGGYGSFIIVLIGFAYLLETVTYDVNRPKLEATSVGQLAEVSTLLATVPSAAKVVDLEGRMLFWQEGYPICCLPFDLTIPYVSRPPLPLATYLSLHTADYIYQGDSGRFSTVSPDNMSYIKTYFAPVPGFGDRLWKRK